MAVVVVVVMVSAAVVVVGSMACDVVVELPARKDVTVGVTDANVELELSEDPMVMEIVLSIPTLVSKVLVGGLAVELLVVVELAVEVLTVVGLVDELLGVMVGVREY
jgi:hypothetical protein